MVQKYKIHLKQHKKEKTDGCPKFGMLKKPEEEGKTPILKLEMKEDLGIKKELEKY